MSTPSFEQLGIRPALQARLKSLGITMPTPVQEQTLPEAMKGHDIIAQAQTGTGKTLAFALPILERVQPDNRNIQALIVTPTRELAIQITKEVAKLASEVGCSVLAAYGGQDVESQIRKLQGSVQIVIGTPGRLLDHLRRGTVQFWKLSTLVLDEADQMLHMGFLNEVEEIISQTSKNRQTMLFSATMPDNVRKLAAQYMRNPVDIRVRSEHITLDAIKQFVVDTSDRNKLPTLLGIIERDRPYLAVIFCRTKVRAKKLTESLQEHGLEADELHGDLSQAKREQVMRKFRSAKLQILVATDVAARGIDVEGVTHVINYDIPHDAEGYIHRIGRTGRAGHSGKAITLASPRDRMTLQAIERGIKMTLARRSMADYGVGADRNDTHEIEADASEGKARRSRQTGGTKPHGGGHRQSSTRSRSEGGTWQPRNAASRSEDGSRRPVRETSGKSGRTSRGMAAAVKPERKQDAAAARGGQARGGGRSTGRSVGAGSSAGSGSRQGGGGRSRGSRPTGRSGGRPGGRS